MTGENSQVFGFENYVVEKKGKHSNNTMKPKHVVNNKNQKNERHDKEIAKMYSVKNKKKMNESDRSSVYSNTSKEEGEKYYNVQTYRYEKVNKPKHIKENKVSRRRHKDDIEEEAKEFKRNNTMANMNIMSLNNTNQRLVQGNYLNPLNYNNSGQPYLNPYINNNMGTLNSYDSMQNLQNMQTMQNFNQNYNYLSQMNQNQPQMMNQSQMMNQMNQNQLNQMNLNQNIEPYSCVYCEDIYKLTIVNNIPLKKLKCLYCGNVTNEQSLSFYQNKYANTEIKKKSNIQEVNSSEEEVSQEIVQKTKKAVKADTADKIDKSKNFKSIKAKQKTKNNKNEEIIVKDEEEDLEEQNNNDSDEEKRAKAKVTAKQDKRKIKQEDDQESDLHNSEEDIKKREKMKRTKDINEKLEEMKRKTEVKPEPVEDESYEDKYIPTKKEGVVLPRPKTGVRTNIGRENEINKHIIAVNKLY